MAGISTTGITGIVRKWTAAAQAWSAKVLDFSEGSVYLALAEAGGAIYLWLQKLALQILGLTRFATSYGADADSWGAQFQFKRLPAVAATGSVTFALSSGTASGTVAVGAVVQTDDGSQSFTVYADPNNAAYNATAAPGGSYVANTIGASITVPVQANVAGPGGNVIEGAISVIVSGVTGFTTVANPARFQNGLLAETDPDYKARFPLYLAGLATGNRAAIEAVVTNVQQGIKYHIVDQQNFFTQTMPYTNDRTYTDIGAGPASNHFDPGNFYVIIDDGSGSPPLSLVQSVYNAINAVVGLTIRYQVYGCIKVNADVVLAIVTAPGIDHNTQVGIAQTAIKNYINSISLNSGGVLPLTRIAQVAYDSSRNITNVPLASIRINNQEADLILNPMQVPSAGLISIT